MKDIFSGMNGLSYLQDLFKHKKSEKSKEKLHLLFIEWYNDNQKDV